MPTKKYSTIGEKKDAQRKARKKYRDSHKKEIKERAKDRRKLCTIAIKEYYENRGKQMPKGGPKKGAKKAKKKFSEKKKLLEGKLKFKNSSEPKKYDELNILDGLMSKLKTIEKKLDD